MVSRIINLALRGLEFFWTLLIMAIVGNMIASAFAGNPSVVNFDMAVAVFSMLSLIYLIAVAFNEGFTGHPLLPLAVDAFNTLLFFCAAIAMAAELGVHSCSNSSYTHHNSITNGSSNTHQRCQEAQATTAFLWFCFVCYTASLVFSITGGAAGGVNLRSGGIRKGAGRV